MGSKHSLLQNGLGNLIIDESSHHDRIVDLFCGGGSVAWFSSENTNLPVLAIDLQSYAVVMSQAIISRSDVVDEIRLKDHWISRAKEVRDGSDLWKEIRQNGHESDDTAKWVEWSRSMCQRPSRIGPIWNAYGGHYFSPAQSLTLDYLIKYLPNNDPYRSICLAAVISAASQCSASPGHTAQPFQPTAGATRYIYEAWRKDVLSFAERALNELCSRHAGVIGEAMLGDAIEVAPTLNDTDLVIVDPPYSGVHYSRFYHVLEAVAQRQIRPVSGVGRYPPLEARPQSSFSRKGESSGALSQLLEGLASTGATIIFTFPASSSSNGLSGAHVISESQKWFNVEEQRVGGTFSTLGGNNKIRAARAESVELILLLKPR